LELVKWTLDPFYEIADIDTASNVFPREPEQPTKFQLFKGGAGRLPQGQNPMQEAVKQKAGAVGGSKN
jgi:hypothetical protein